MFVFTPAAFRSDQRMVRIGGNPIVFSNSNRITILGENTPMVRLATNRSWNLTGNFDYESIKNPRLAFDADRCIPPRQGQLFPVAAPLSGI